MILLQKNCVILFFTMLFFLSSCVLEGIDIEPKCKNQCTVIKGRLVTKDGTVPIPNVEIRAGWERHGMFRYEYRLKAKTKTNAEGYYELSFYIEDDEVPQRGFPIRVSCFIDQKHYWFPTNQDGYVDIDLPFELKRNTIFQVPDCLIPKPAYIKLRTLNPQDIKNNDDGIWSTFYMRRGVASPHDEFRTWFEWNNSNSTDYKVTADQPIKIYTTKTKNGVTIHETETIIVPEGSTYEIVKEF